MRDNSHNERLTKSTPRYTHLTNRGRDSSYYIPPSANFSGLEGSVSGAEFSGRLEGAVRIGMVVPGFIRVTDDGGHGWWVNTLRLERVVEYLKYSERDPEEMLYRGSVLWFIGGEKLWVRESPEVVLESIRALGLNEANGIDKARS